MQFFIIGVSWCLAEMNLFFYSNIIGLDLIFLYLYYRQRNRVLQANVIFGTSGCAVISLIYIWQLFGGEGDYHIDEGEILDQLCIFFLALILRNQSQLRVAVLQNHAAAPAVSQLQSASLPT